MMPTTPPASRKYTRRRNPVSFWGLLIGFIVGIGGAFFLARELYPLPQTDARPAQLTRDDRTAYIAAIALAFTYDSDVDRAVSRLLDLQLPGDPIQAVADLACQLTTSGYVNSTQGLRAVQAMIRFYSLQGRAGCADTLLLADAAPTRVIEVALPTNTPGLVPPPTKTPSPVDLVTPTPLQPLIPTSPPQSDFELVGVSTGCSTTRPGVIEVLVYEANGATGVPGVGVRVRWSGGENLFFTGLLPERDPGYADFVMQDGLNYLIDLPGRADPLPDPLTPTPCTTETGERSIITYRVIFRRVA